MTALNKQWYTSLQVGRNDEAKTMVPYERVIRIMSGPCAR